MPRRIRLALPARLALDRPLGVVTAGSLQLRGIQSTFVSQCTGNMRRCWGGEEAWCYLGRRSWNLTVPRGSGPTIQNAHTWQGHSGAADLNRISLCLFVCRKAATLPSPSSTWANDPVEEAENHRPRLPLQLACIPLWWLLLTLNLSILRRRQFLWWSRRRQRVCQCSEANAIALTPQEQPARYTDVSVRLRKKSITVSRTNPCLSRGTR